MSDKKMYADSTEVASTMLDAFKGVVLLETMYSDESIEECSVIGSMIGQISHGGYLLLMNVPFPLDRRVLYTEMVRYWAWGMLSAHDGADFFIFASQYPISTVTAALVGDLATNDWLEAYFLGWPIGSLSDVARLAIRAVAAGMYVGRRTTRAEE